MRPRVALPVAATALSAFLLFALELYAGRCPAVFGGSPAVWTTALCFFTGAVFLGYLYAHLLVTRMPWRTARIIQLVVVAVALRPLLSRRRTWRSFGSPGCRPR